MAKVTESGMNRYSSMSSTIMQSLAFITFMMSEKFLMLKFLTSPNTWLTKNMLIISLEYTSNSYNSHIVYDLFNICSNHMMYKLQWTRIWTRWANAQMTHFSEKLVMSLKYTPVTQSILCLIFLMYIATSQHLNYSGQENLKFKRERETERTECSYVSDTPVNLKQDKSSNLARTGRPQARLKSCKVWRISVNQCLPKTQS